MKQSGQPHCKSRPIYLPVQAYCDRVQRSNARTIWQPRKVDVLDPIGRESCWRSLHSSSNLRVWVLCPKSRYQLGRRVRLRRINLGYNQPVRNLDLPPREGFAEKLIEPVRRLYRDYRLGDDDMTHQDGIAADSINDRPGVSEAAGLEHDAAQPICGGVDAAALVANPAKKAQKPRATVAAGAASGQDFGATGACEESVVNSSIGGLVDNHQCIAEDALVKLVSQPRRFA